MKSSKLIDIFKNGNIVIPVYFIQHFNDFKIKWDEFIFLIYLYNKGNNFLFDPARFSNDLNIDLELIMNYISTLCDKKFIRVEVVKNEKGLMEEVVIMDEFFDKVSLMMIDEVNSSNNRDNSNIFEIIEREFGRTLSPIEYEIIKAWLDSNINEDLIKEAIKEATFNGVSNLRYIDKILYEWGKSGIKTVSDVERSRKKRRKREEADENIDLDIVDWDWFDDED